ncbi:hypothetical protein VP01_519g2 [Puccinia sorghi]|uniref:Uncharacterized protein n=1 Tax=Puccinia sorghi TaxID=27349 RepID=A0A0L6UKR3_9BASI|nr:hypothetical protein VP01_519g2 [Puccinia sorghi]
MKSPTQEANSLSEFHWLFSDEQPLESLPPFFPRVLNFGQSDSQLIQASSSFLPRRRSRAASAYEEEVGSISYEEASPIFNPDSPRRSHAAADSPVYIPDDRSAPTDALPLGCDPRLDSLQPVEIPTVIPRCDYSLKRPSEGETFQQEDLRPWKYSRVSEVPSSNPSQRSSFDASSAYTRPSTASPPLGCSEPTGGLNHMRFEHLIEIQGLRAQLAMSEARNASAVAELAEARTCIGFLLKEVRRVISSTQHCQIAKKAERIVRRTDHHLDLFARIPMPPSDPTPSQQAPLPALQSMSRRYCFADDPVAATEFQPATLASTSQLVSVDGGLLEPLQSLGVRGPTSYGEAGRVPFRECVPPRSTSFLPHPRRTFDPEGSQLAAQDWSHSRQDSYLNLYYTEAAPPPFPHPHVGLPQNYQPPIHSSG